MIPKGYFFLPYTVTLHTKAASIDFVWPSPLFVMVLPSFRVYAGCRKRAFLILSPTVLYNRTLRDPKRQARQL